MIAALIERDLRRAFSGAASLPVGFFLLVAALVPFAVGPDPVLLRRIGGGTLWIAALTAALLPVERLIEPDRADGVLDQLACRGITEEMIASAKIVAHWLSFGPLLLLGSIAASLLLGLDPATLARAAMSLAIGTPGLAALTLAVASLTAGLPRAGALSGMLLLPIAVPLLIFGAAASLEGGAALALEAAVSLLLVASAPFVAGAAIRAART